MHFAIVLCHLVKVLLIISSLIELISNEQLNKVIYSYEYSVNEPTDYNVITHHWEKRQGFQVHGGYSLLQADGKVRVVQYHVDGKRGFRAFVTFRRPATPTGHFIGHLKYPIEYRMPIRLAEPVSLITPDLFDHNTNEKYPNLP